MKDNTIFLFHEVLVPKFRWIKKKEELTLNKHLPVLYKTSLSRKIPNKTGPEEISLKATFSFIHCHAEPYCSFFNDNRSLMNNWFALSRYAIVLPKPTESLLGMAWLCVTREVCHVFRFSLVGVNVNDLNSLPASLSVTMYVMKGLDETCATFNRVLTQRVPTGFSDVIPSLKYKSPSVSSIAYTMFGEPDSIDFQARFC